MATEGKRVPARGRDDGDREARALARRLAEAWELDPVLMKQALAPASVRDVIALDRMEDMW